MSLIPRPRWPEEPNPPYDFEGVDKERFAAMGAMMTRLAEQRDTTNMRDAILRLYTEDGGVQ